MSFELVGRFLPMPPGQQNMLYKGLVAYGDNRPKSHIDS